MGLNATGSGTATWILGADNGSGAGANAYAIYDAVNSSYRMVINNSGNVGIGTNTPQSKFTVKSAGSGYNAGLFFGGSTVASILPYNGVIYLSAGTYYEGAVWQYYRSAGSSLFAMNETTGVDWYSGTGDSYSNVVSNVKLWDASGIWKNMVRSSQSGDSYFTGGNVGIGTTAPGAKLDVQGSILTTAGAPVGKATVYGYKDYAQTSGAGTGTSFVDTGITPGQGYIFEVHVAGSPNPGSGCGYKSINIGYIMISAGWSGSAVQHTVSYQSLANANGNMGTLSTSVIFLSGGSEVATTTDGSAVIRIKVAGYYPPYTGQCQTVRMKMIY